MKMERRIKRLEEETKRLETKRQSMLCEVLALREVAIEYSLLTSTVSSGALALAKARAQERLTRHLIAGEFPPHRMEEATEALDVLFSAFADARIEADRPKTLIS